MQTLTGSGPRRAGCQQSAVDMSGEGAVGRILTARCGGTRIASSAAAAAGGDDPPLLNSTGLPLPRLSMRAAKQQAGHQMAATNKLTSSSAHGLVVQSSPCAQPAKAQHSTNQAATCFVAKLTSQPTLLMTTGLPLSSDSMWASSSACCSISSARRYRICGCHRGGNRGAASEGGRGRATVGRYSVRAAPGGLAGWLACAGQSNGSLQASRLDC